jgi:Flp pilus assembly pilin Flp
VKRKSSRGQGLVEYALMLALISAVAIGGLLFLGRHIQSDLSNVGTKLAIPAIVNGGDDGGGNGNGNDHGGGHGNGH